MTRDMNVALVPKGFVHLRAQIEQTYYILFCTCSCFILVIIDLSGTALVK